MKFPKIKHLKLKLYNAIYRRAFWNSEIDLTLNGKYMGKMTRKDYFMSNISNMGNINQGTWKLYGVEDENNQAN